MSLLFNRLMFNRLMGRLWPFGIGGVGVEDGWVKAAEAGCNPLQQASLVQQPYQQPVAASRMQRLWLPAQMNQRSSCTAAVQPNI